MTEPVEPPGVVYTFDRLQACAAIREDFDAGLAAVDAVPAGPLRSILDQMVLQMQQQWDSEMSAHPNVSVGFSPLWVAADPRTADQIPIFALFYKNFRDVAEQAAASVAAPA